MIYTAVAGNNAELIEKVVDLYVKDGQTVADVTYGKGAFWTKTDTSLFKLLATDIKTTCPTCDFRRLKYKDGTIDHVVLDPPYMHNAGTPMHEKRYQNAGTTKGMYHVDIMKLYRQGIAEAMRVLKQNGKLWVKCQDEIESGYQRWSHIEIYDYATRLGFFGKDLFVMLRTNNPVIQQKRQLHARKNHSYLWIFEVPDSKQRKGIARYVLQ